MSGHTDANSDPKEPSSRWLLITDLRRCEMAFEFGLVLQP